MKNSNRSGSPERVQGREDSFCKGLSKVLVILFLAVITVQAATATDISSKREIIELGSPTKVTIHINYTDITSNQISTLVPSSHNPSSVRGQGPSGEISCSYFDAREEIICDPGEIENGYQVTITYKTPNPSYFKNGYRQFEHVERILAPTTQYSLRVLLPEGYGLIKSEDAKPLVPDADTSSEGRKIHITWVDNEISIGDTLEFRAKYQELNVLNIFPGYTAVALTIILVVVATVIALRLRGRKDEKTIASILPILKDDESKVLKYLIEQEGECEQKKLVENLDYSKAKISRLVKNLQERNLIEKIKEGRKNRLTLKRKIGDIELSEI
ncbi:MAG: hypothetical protein SVV03_03300 [Candidatus Nanohaloarchaea archaeon]|nr:hypothetical protein [Candidatus Nanohaloarchaea archaeon]